MKTMLVAFASIALIAVLVHQGLERAGFSSAEMTSSENVRLN